jgi:hypothetical protein
VIAATLSSLVPAAAWAQRPASAPVWSIEVHGGLMTAQAARGRGAAEFPAGATFTTAGGDPSRRVPSWYFGDGARLFNEVQQQFATRFGVSFPAIVPLDPMLTGASAERAAGISAGARVRRRMSPRYSIEAAFAYARTPLQLRPGARRAIEETSASFEDAFTGLLSTAPIADLRVSSAAEFNDRRGHQLSVTGALVLDVLRRGRVGIYAVGGAGLLASGGSTAEARLRGSYQFSLFGVIPYNENDTVTIQLVDRRRAAVGVAGGGITYDLRARQALRVDVRAELGAGGVRTLVSSSAALARGMPAEALPSATSPSIQFSTTDAHPSSLMPGRTETETFSGGGLHIRAHFTVGYVFRF